MTGVGRSSIRKMKVSDGATDTEVTTVGPSPASGESTGPPEPSQVKGADAIGDGRRPLQGVRATLAATAIPRYTRTATSRAKNRMTLTSIKTQSGGPLSREEAPDVSKPRSV